MNTQNCSTQALLSLLVGKRIASTLSKIPLSVLFDLRPSSHGIAETMPPYTTHPIIVAAKELMTRALQEELNLSPISFGSPNTVKDYLRLTLAGREQEVFMALFLDAQHRLIASEILFHGTLTQASVYPREVVKRGLAHNAAAVMFAHNHPSGVSQPSPADHKLTLALKQALALVDIRVLDHIVIGEQEALSFAERGWL